MEGPRASSARPRCSVYIATSLDGFIARPDGGLDWLSAMNRPGEDYGYQRFFDSVDALVMGRKTYRVALGFDPWPYQGKRCVVLAHNPRPPRHGEEFHSGPPGPLLARLAADGVKRIYIDGGAVVREFLAAGLIDDLTVSVIPVLLGQGIPLFGGGGEHRLHLLESRAFESGLVQLSYQIAVSSGPAIPRG
jgi:dihydrofolate reductase